MRDLVWLARMIARAATFRVRFSACRAGDPEIVIEVHADRVFAELTCEATGAEPQCDTTDTDLIATVWTEDRVMKWEIYCDLAEHWSGFGRFELKARRRFGHRRRLRNAIAPRRLVPASAF